MSTRKTVKSATKKPTGIRTTLTEKMKDEMMGRLADGETLTSICRSMKVKPRDVYYLAEVDEEFSKRLFSAREFGDLVLEDEAIDISDAPDFVVATIETRGGSRDSVMRESRDNVARSRLRAETRLKTVARRKGARITQEIRMLKKSEDDVVASMSAEELLQIARMNVSEQGSRGDWGGTNDKS